MDKPIQFLPVNGMPVRVRHKYTGHEGYVDNIFQDGPYWYVTVEFDINGTRASHLSTSLEIVE